MHWREVWGVRHGDAAWGAGHAALWYCSWGYTARLWLPSTRGAVLRRTAGRALMRWQQLYGWMYVHVLCPTDAVHGTNQGPASLQAIRTLDYSFEHELELLSWCRLSSRQYSPLFHLVSQPTSERNLRLGSIA